VTRFVESNHRLPGVWGILFRGAVLSVIFGTLLFCVVPTLAVRLLPMAGVSIQ
jgi:hypothetical protein